MAGMQRFVTYIYAYDDGQKSSNAGYAKIETRGNAGRMEIHFMGASALRGTGNVYFLQEQNGKFLYFPAGEFAVENGTGVFQVPFLTGNVLDSGFDFEQIDGIYIKDSMDRMHLSFWKDVKVVNFVKELFVARGENEPEPLQMPEQAGTDETPAEAHISQDASQTPEEAVTVDESQVPAEEIASPEISGEQQLEEAEQEMLHTMEIPVRNVFPQVRMEDIWQYLQKNRLCVQINENVCAVQIELKDLRELPKKYWYLGNNSFLLHGFFNYHYLLLGKLPDGNWFLGVPGIYQRQERVMASIFGFPGFLSAGDMSKQTASRTEDNQRRMENGFRQTEESTHELQPGAWYHILEN